MKLKYFFAKIKCRFSKDRREYMSDYFRKLGMNIGSGCNICSDISTTESYLVTIGSNVTVSTEVLLLTHDASIGKVLGKENGSDLLGKIVIGNNCFIGARSIILPGVSLTENIIVAAGSVVTKSFNEENIIIGGNPAKKIGDWEQFQIKNENNAFKLHGKKGKLAKEVVTKSIGKLINK